MLFGSADLGILSRVQPIAEELVGEHFRLTSFGPQDRCYEIVTLSESECREETALAKLCRYDRRERVIAEGQCVSRFYRICLQDDNILTWATEGFELGALLLYVLTHELIHVVRFESFQVHFEATGVTRDREEETVHRLTQGVLEALHDDNVDEVIEGLSPARVDVLVSQR